MPTRCCASAHWARLVLCIMAGWVEAGKAVSGCCLLPAAFVGNPAEGVPSTYPFVGTCLQILTMHYSTHSTVSLALVHLSREAAGLPQFAVGPAALLALE